MLNIRRGATQFDLEKEDFPKTQLNALLKSLSLQEAAIKEKHCRTMIIGSFQEKGATLFWKLLKENVPVYSNDIIAWKFCILLHKLIFEGHENVVKDSLSQLDFLNEIQRTWAQRNSGYGKLASFYSEMIVEKLSFHGRHSWLPGNMAAAGVEGGPQSASAAASFELCVELFDHMEAINKLQNAVLSTFDAMKGNSVTNSSQCRLCSLVTCINEAAKVLDILILHMTRLHKFLDLSCLDGHRSRFTRIYSETYNIFEKLRNLQYFIGKSIPHIPKNQVSFCVVAPFPEEENPSSSPSSSSSHRREQEIYSLRQENELLVERLKNLEELLKLSTQNSQEMHQQKERIRFLEESLIQERSQYEMTISQLRTNENFLREELNRATTNFIHPEEGGNKLEKLSEAYQKIRNEHIVLLRKKSDDEKKIASLKEKLLTYEKCRMKLLNLVSKDGSGEMDDILCHLESELESQRKAIGTLENSLLKEMDKNSDLKRSNENLLQKFEKVVKENDRNEEFCEKWRANLLELAEDLPSKCEMTSEIFNNFKSDFLNDKLYASEKVIQTLIAKDAGKDELKRPLDAIKKFLKQGEEQGIEGELEESLMALTKEEGTDSFSDLVDRELSLMENSICKAAETMEDLMFVQSSSEAVAAGFVGSSIDLEMNTQIIDSCSSLIEVIQKLIRISRALQSEITVRDHKYYKKNPEWTQGLISAAKAIGAGANLLMTSANDVVRRNGKFESLIAASQEISASTAQIVVASRVKAPKDSENLSKLNGVSKEVTSATARVIATCRTCCAAVSSAIDDDDFSSLTPHQTKYMEMECQVKILEMESQLEQQRKKLFQLRKLRYANNNSE